MKEILINTIKAMVELISLHVNKDVDIDWLGYTYGYLEKIVEEAVGPEKLDMVCNYVWDSSYEHRDVPTVEEFVDFLLIKEDWDF